MSEPILVTGATGNVGRAVIEAVVENPKHRNVAYTLTGSEALTFDDVAALLTSELGRAFRYRRASLVGYLRHL